MLNTFNPYPFERLRTLLADITPHNAPIFTLSIGEPQFDTPQNIIQSWQENANLLNKYPKSSGEIYLKNAMLNFIKTRYDLTLEESQIIPTLGTREVLFNFPQFFCFGLENPTIAYPNPFYQIYEGAGKAANARVILMDLNENNAFQPRLTKAQLENVNLVILNSPNNPTGRILELDELAEWVKLALAYNFVILNDECYSEIYESKAPPSILQAALKARNHAFKNVLAINSISKRSSAPGLRSGFIAGDSEILRHYNLYRTYLGCALPLPLQKAASVAWSDSKSAEEIRLIYARNLALAREILHLDESTLSPYSFYVWLKVGDEKINKNLSSDEAFTRFAYEKSGIIVLPGSYLGRNGAGRGYVRIALVYDNEIMCQALNALQNALTLYQRNAQ